MVGVGLMAIPFPQLLLAYLNERERASRNDENGVHSVVNDPNTVIIEGEWIEESSRYSQIDVMALIDMHMSDEDNQIEPEL